MVRIRIVGGPGSGKTTLAKRLSAKLKVPHYDLDALYLHEKDTDYSRIRDEKERNAKTIRIADRKDWVIEGAFTGDWVEKTFSNADRIVILETSQLKRNGRILTRFVRYKTGIEQSPKKEKLKGVYGMVKWNLLRYDSITLARIDRKKYAKKLTVLKTNRDVEKFLESV